MSIIYTGGTFDLYHMGHVLFLKRCKEIAGPYGKVIVSLNTDEFIEQYKGKPPVYNNTERLTIVKSCRYVDDVVWNTGGKNSKEAIQKVNPNYIIIGSDWAKKDYYTQMGFDQDWLDKNNIGLIYIPYTYGISSTELKERIIK